MTLRHILLLLFILCPLMHLSAQDVENVPVPDSVSVNVDAQKTDSFTIDTAAFRSITDNILHQKRIRRDLTTFRPDPIRAMWLALVLPGAGQFYNRKYWKLPIVYGGFLGCVYALTWNGQMLSDYSQAYLDIMDSDPNTKSYEKMLPLNYSIEGKEERFKGIFKSKKDTFRRFRDLSIFALLRCLAQEDDGFDINRDLSIQLMPTMLETERTDMRHRQTTPGIQCVINF